MELKQLKIKIAEICDCTDLNAIHEVEKSLDNLQAHWFWRHLQDVTGYKDRRLVSATAEQRAEALSRIIRKQR